MDSKNKKLSLEDLKVGMYVSISDLDNIRDIPIVLRDSSIDYSKPELVGEIVSIGDIGKQNIVKGDSVFIYNTTDSENFDGEL